jgi:hypothetical protein
MREDIIAIVCPDIHGRNFWKEVAKEYDGSIPFICLGDYLDAYPHEGITTEEVKKNFEELWEFKQKWGEKVVLLLGNHDFSYIDRLFRCCRFNYELAEWYINFLNENWETFKVAYDIENNNHKFLLTHAGVHPQWLEQNDFENNYNAEYINSLLLTHKSSFASYSSYRGGSFWETGSPIWADIREFADSVHIDNNAIGHNPAFTQPRNLTQIVGHTQLNAGLLNVENIYCIDSRQAFVITKDNKIETYKIKED